MLVCLLDIKIQSFPIREIKLQDCPKKDDFCVKGMEMMISYLNYCV